jgi:hypothetical protein
MLLFQMQKLSDAIWDENITVKGEQEKIEKKMVVTRFKVPSSHCLDE